MNQFINFLANNAHLVNLIWWITIAASLAILLVSIYYPYGRTARIFPLSIMFNPKENVDLDFQSVGYTMMHSTWFARITHYTIFVDAFFWFIVFGCIHWSLGLSTFLLMVFQSGKISEKSFTKLFLIIGGIYFLFSLYVVFNYGGNVFVNGFSNPLWLFSISFLMFTGVLRFLGHLTEPVPPLMFDDSDQFVKINRKNFKIKVLLTTPFYGYVAEFSSGLPSRLFAVQVNYVNQKLLKAKTVKIKSWESIRKEGEEALKGGYKVNEQLNIYFENIKHPSKVR